MDWKSLGEKIAAVGLPLLGGALGGPGGALIGKTVAASLGLGTDATPEQAAVALGQVSGDQLVKLRTLESDLAKEQLRTGLQADQAQVEVNKIEASSGKLWQGGWRPAAGWASVAIGLIYPAIRVLLPWTLTVAGVEGVPPLPPLDGAEAMMVLGSLLGISTQRHLERKAGKC